MRLQLTVQRHGLPPAQILWTVNSTVSAPVKPPNGAPGTGTTISQFLEQVNEIIPLEADHWGLEDYAVEVQGFECLHFSELSQVLRENDEVCIRPLQTSDLRVRKFSGRHQISTDGKHLIDGVTFGRPFLKRADRPSIRIPPRKRKRITYSQDDNSISNSENNDKQVIVRAGFDNADERDDEDETKDDEDFDPNAENDEDLDAGAEDDEGLEDELEGLHNDLQRDKEDFASTRRSRTRSGRDSTGLGLEFYGDGIYHNPLLEQYSQDEPLVGPSALKVRARASKNRHKVSSSKNPKSVLSPQRVNRRDSAGSFKSVHFEDGEATTPATVFEGKEDGDDDDVVEDSHEEDENDGDFHPAGLGGSADLDESDKENTEPAADTISPSDTSSSSISSLSDSDYSRDELEDETSSSGTYSSNLDSDSDTAPDQLSSKFENKDREDAKSSTLSPTSRSNSGLDHGKQDMKAMSATGRRTPNTSLGETSTEIKRIPAANPPGPSRAGKQSTRTRNLRRKASAALKYHKANGDLREDATIGDLIRKKERDNSSIPPWMVEMRSKLQNNVCQKFNDQQKGLEKEGNDAAEIAAKRKALLSSLEIEEGVDASIEKEHTNDKPTYVRENVEYERVEQPTSHERQREENDGPFSSQNVGRGSESNTVQVPDSLPNIAEPTLDRADENQPVEVPLPSSIPPDASMDPISAPSGSQKRRAKLDLAGSKRLLFGSLGLKAPKTKEDESALREKLMKEVRPIKPVKQRVAEIEEAGTLSAENDEDSWKDKIELAAVECCHDGIVLSTPPFPFMQRWDPQQQGTYSKRKGKKNRKRKRIDQSQYEGSYLESPLPESPSKVARQESYDPNMEQPQFDAVAFEQDDVRESHGWSHDHSIQDSAAANEQLLRETSESAAYANAGLARAPEAEKLSDLPSLPPDLTKCQELKKRHCLPGAIIAFKKFLMSAETNWQPGISEYLTAAVDSLKEDGTLVVTLAERDQPKSAARYHKETGERLYSKFEMPGFDDENASNDRKRLEMPFNELINPLLIGSTNSNRDPTNEREATVSSKPDETLAGDEAQRPMLEAQAPLSFDSNLENPVRLEAEIAAPTESARQEIVEMIQDAGWRSSLGSAVGEELGLNGHSASSQLNDHYDAAALDFLAPNSGEFDSNAQVIGIRSASSPLPAKFQASKKPQNPKAEASRSELNKEEDSFAGSVSQAVVQYPSLPQSNEESELFQDQRQHRSVSIESDLQSAPQECISPPPIRRGRGKTNLSPSQSSQSQEPAKRVPKLISTLDGAGDSDEFPELFSQAFEARISQEPTIKKESMEEYDVEKIPKKRGKLGASGKSNYDSGSWKTELSGSEEDASSFRPSQSQVAQSSQIVDLTISSDALESVLDENEEVSSYKSCIGWVDKPRANKDIGVGKLSNRRKARSTSAMA